MKRYVVHTFKTPKAWTNWSDSAIECLNNKGLCQYCSIPELNLENTCVMKYTVKNLLDLLGKPKECKITDEQIQIYFKNLV